MWLQCARWFSVVRRVASRLQGLARGIQINGSGRDGITSPHPHLLPKLPPTRPTHLSTVAARILVPWRCVLQWCLRESRNFQVARAVLQPVSSQAPAPRHDPAPPSRHSLRPQQ